MKTSFFRSRVCTGRAGSLELSMLTVSTPTSLAPADTRCRARSSEICGYEWYSSRPQYLSQPKLNKTA